ncbi:MAG TPA: NADAR family protein [Rubrivivax sp.]|nr:NADAR family protein [Rubrivivax sp.]
MQEIKFYRANEEPYGRFSNLFKRSIVFEGETFETSEHAYQAGKPRKPQVRAWILAAPSPALVAMAAHGLYWWDIRSDWSKIKFDRMRDVLRAKFSQHDDLRELLLSTGDARLVEAATVATPVNRTWGEVNGVGKNMLGKLLMEVREELRAAATKPPATTAVRRARRAAGTALAAA